MDAMCLFRAVFIGFLLTVNGDLAKETDAQKFSTNDLIHLFGIDDHANVPDYEFIDLDKLIKHQRDHKKDSVCFKAFNKHFCIKFIPNKELAGQTHTIEFHEKNGTVEKYTNVLKRYTLGTVNDDSKSHAAFHDSGRGVTGHMKVSDQLYFVNYLPHDMKSPGNNHVIYRRKRRDTTLETMESGILDLRSKIDETKQHKNMPMYLKNELTEKTMELMIAADYKMWQFYKTEFLTGYMIAVANIVYGFFQDPSLAYPLKIALVKIVIFKTDVFKAKTMYDLLDKFAAWCVKNNPKDDSDPEHWDNSMIITRNGCADGCTVEGLAVDVLCSPRSAAVLKDRGLMTSISAVHEIGHTLHLNHDDGKPCKDAINFMASGSTPGGGPSEEWSECSSKVMEKVLKSPQAQCYNDKPVKTKQIKFRLYGMKYDADKQCQFINGPNFVKCIHTWQRCDGLYCSTKERRNVCPTIFYPPIDGTACGPNMWCIHGQCEPDGTKPNPPVNGGWSAWGPYTKCTKVCGIGDQWEERTCTNPAPAYGGLPCKGIKKRNFRSCNTQKCPGGNYPTRLQQCQKIDSKYNDAYYHAPSPCKLLCGFKGKSNFLFANVLDGTRCGRYHGEEFSSFLRTAPAVCINGKCEKMGCDAVLGSGAVIDRCGVCDGDGSSCQFYQGKDTKLYNKRGSYFVTKIPVGAYKIEVKEMKPTWLGFLGFKVGTSPNYALSLPRASYGQAYKLDGTPINYYMQAYNFADKITVEGKISKSISIYYYCYYGRYSPSKGVEWKYYGIPDGKAEKPTFKWVAKKFTKCNRLCAGGQKYREVICIRTDDNSQVSKQSCSESEKPLTVESCNKADCKPEWYITKWSHCTKSCGNGTMRRKIFCSDTTITGRKYVDETLCKAIPRLNDPTFRYCNAKVCAPKWHVTKFSQCDKSCGRGIKYRKVYCKHISKDGKLKITSPVACILHKKPVLFVHCNDNMCQPKQYTKGVIMS